MERIGSWFDVGGDGNCADVVVAINGEGVMHRCW